MTPPPKVPKFPRNLPTLRQAARSQKAEERLQSTLKALGELAKSKFSGPARWRQKLNRDGSVRAYVVSFSAIPSAPIFTAYTGLFDGWRDEFYEWIDIDTDAAAKSITVTIAPPPEGAK